MIAAIDCDLRKLYYVDELGNALRAESITELVEQFMTVPAPSTLLFEIAGATDYTKEKGPGVAYNKRRWTIYNAVAAGALSAILPVQVKMLVSPSSLWTRRFELTVRHKMAGCKQKQKDLRECEAMMWFHRHYPAAWTPLADYLETL